jgi:hypothetical protein
MNVCFWRVEATDAAKRSTGCVHQAKNPSRKNWAIQDTEVKTAMRDVTNRLEYSPIWGSWPQLLVATINDGAGSEAARESYR